MSILVLSYQSGTGRRFEADVKVAVVPPYEHSCRALLSLGPLGPADEPRASARRRGRPALGLRAPWPEGDGSEQT